MERVIEHASVKTDGKTCLPDMVIRFTQRRINPDQRCNDAEKQYNATGILLVNEFADRLNDAINRGLSHDDKGERNVVLGKYRPKSLLPKKKFISPDLI